MSTFRPCRDGRLSIDRASNTGSSVGRANVRCTAYGRCSVLPSLTSKPASYSDGQPCQPPKGGRPGDREVLGIHNEKNRPQNTDAEPIDDHRRPSTTIGPPPTPIDFRVGLPGMHRAPAGNKRVHRGKIRVTLYVIRVSHF